MFQLVFVYLFACLFCLFAASRKNYCSDLRENFTIGVYLDKEEVLKN